MSPASTEPARPWRVLAARGWGSAIAEAVLTACGIAYERELVDPSTPGPDRDRLRTLNLLGQLPTVVLPDGSVLTESAAIALYACERSPHAGLVPPPGDGRRAELLRWLMFLVAALYPTFTYGDEPKRWVATAEGELRRSTDEHRKELWRTLEGVAASPWFLGDRFTVLDLYVGVMTRWRPGRAWFAEHCPKLDAIARAVDARPDLAGVWAANFGT